MLKDEQFNLCIYQSALKKLFARVIAELENAGIRFWGIAGTALGAARHGDMIPWDDDIDIGVLRADYGRALKIIEKSRELYVWDWDRDRRCHIACARVFNRISYGISKYDKCAYIDIAPIDYAPKTLIGMFVCEAMSISLKRLICRKNGAFLHYKAWTIRSCLLGLFSLPFMFFSVGSLKKLYVFIIARHNSMRTWCPAFAKKFISPVKCFQAAHKAKFGELSIPIPYDADDYLTSIYGNWRTPPNANQRAGHAVNCIGEMWERLPDDELRMLGPVA